MIEYAMQVVSHNAVMVLIMMEMASQTQDQTEISAA
jgi:hypothetical protein